MDVLNEEVPEERFKDLSNLKFKKFENAKKKGDNNGKQHYSKTYR